MHNANHKHENHKLIYMQILNTVYELLPISLLWLISWLIS